MVISHANIKNKMILEANKLPGVKLWPNPTGLAWNGTIVREYTKGGHKYALLRDPRPIKYGLGKGILDTIGFKAETIGRVIIPRFVAFDAKAGKDYLKPGQKDFIKMVTKYGGIADEIRDPFDVVEKLRQPLRTGEINE